MFLLAVFRDSRFSSIMDLLKQFDENVLGDCFSNAISYILCRLEIECSAFTRFLSCALLVLLLWYLSKCFLFLVWLCELQEEGKMFQVRPKKRW